MYKPQIAQNNTKRDPSNKNLTIYSQAKRIHISHKKIISQTLDIHWVTIWSHAAGWTDFIFHYLKTASQTLEIHGQCIKIWIWSSMARANQTQCKSEDASKIPLFWRNFITYISLEQPTKQNTELLEGTELLIIISEASY